MTLIRFFIDAATRTRFALPIVSLAAVTGLASGATNTWILAIVHQSVTSGTRPGARGILTFALLCAAMVAMRAASQVLLTRFGISISRYVRLRMCHLIVGANLRKLEEIGPARLLGAFTEDTPAITNGVAVLPTLCVNAVIGLGCLAYIAWLSWPLLATVLVAGGIGVSVYRLMQRQARDRFLVAYGRYVTLLKNFRTLVDGAKELKLHAERRTEFIGTEIEATTDAVAEHRFVAAVWFAIAENWVTGMVFLVIGLLLLTPGFFGGVDAAGLTGSVLVFLYLTQPVQAMLGALPSLTQAQVAVKKIRVVEDALSSGAASTPQRPLARAAAPCRLLELRGLCHTYMRDGQGGFTLGPIDLTLRAGEITFIAGGNGSGKTTLMKLLTGLYAAERGEILVDGVRVTADTMDWYRSHFSAVFADFHLFDRLLGLPEMDAAAERYLAVLQLANKVQIKDGQLSTTELSQGQRKRLALLTAYLEDRPIYVFDEWAADQDPVFREFFYMQLLPELRDRGKTLLVVSHDDRYYGLADQLIKLDYGAIDYVRAAGSRETESRETDSRETIGVA